MGSKLQYDLTGKKFGRLTALQWLGGRGGKWWCKCGCGQFVKVRSSHLRQGLTKSCGCLQRDIRSKQANILIGSKFGKLEVLKAHPTQNTRGTRQWNCLCTCGKTVVMTKSRLHLIQARNTGCKHCSGKVSDSDVQSIRENIANGATLASQATEYGINVSYVSLIATGKRRKDVKPKKN